MQNFNKNYENENYYILNACGLAIFFKFYSTFIGSSVICLSLSEIPIWTHQREFRVKRHKLSYDTEKMIRNK
jgi:hypothetical protein